MLRDPSTAQKPSLPLLVVLFDLEKALSVCGHEVVRCALAVSETLSTFSIARVVYSDPPISAAAGLRCSLAAKCARGWHHLNRVLYSYTFIVFGGEK